jgi:formiminotetrahydrofolate cyclodeaminase
MKYIDKSVRAFTEALASKAPTPGGGGASALAGALGAALGTMVGNLTVGKKKYQDVEADVLALMEEMEDLRRRLLELVDGDAEVFAPLAEAYGIPKEHPERAEIMEGALRLAVSVPIEIMECAARAIELHAQLGQKGSLLALSDVGVGVLFCKAALMGASLNVSVNTALMQDAKFAAELDARAAALIAEYGALADTVYEQVIKTVSR